VPAVQAYRQDAVQGQHCVFERGHG
jgi:hypothetical protein